MGCHSSKPKEAPAAQKDKAAAPAEEKKEESAVLLDTGADAKPADGGAADAKPEACAAEAKPEEGEAKPEEGEAAKPDTIKVEVISARGLRNADYLGKSEPYCIVQVAGKSEEDGKARFKEQTKIAESATTPEWNQAFEVEGFSAGDSLVFLVKDKDTLQDDLLGTATLTEQQVRDGLVDELPLTGTAQGVEAFLKVKVNAGILQEAAAAVEEKVEAAVEAVTDKCEEIKDKVDDVIDDAKEALDKAKDKIEDAVEDVKVVIEDESSKVNCSCMSSPQPGGK